MSELTMPQTAGDMQPHALEEFYKEALSAGSFTDVTGSVVYARYDDVRRLLATPDVFGNDYPSDPTVPGTLSPRYPLGRQAVGEAISLFSQIPANTAAGNGPQHRRNRQVMEDEMPIGHRKAADQLGDSIRSRVDSLLIRQLQPELLAPDTISPLGFTALSGQVDAVPGTREMTMQIIADFLGVPDDPQMRRSLLQGGADQIALLGTQLDEPGQLRKLQSFRNLWTLTQDLVAQASPDDASYTGRALAHKTGGRPTLSRKEVAGANINLTVAGFSTLYESMTNGLRWMGEHPADWQQAVASQHNMTRITSELLRLCGGIYAWGRVALQEVELGGRTLCAGTPVLGLIGAANRDPRHFGDDPDQDPNRLIPYRSVRSDLVFGAAPGREHRADSHYCPGAGIARVVMTEFFSAFAQEYPDFRLATLEPPMLHNLMFREQAALSLDLRSSTH